MLGLGPDAEGRGGWLPGPVTALGEDTAHGTKGCRAGQRTEHQAKPAPEGQSKPFTRATEKYGLGAVSSAHWEAGAGRDSAPKGRPRRRWRSTWPRRRWRSTPLERWRGLQRGPEPRGKWWGRGGQAVRLEIPALPLTSCVTVENLLNCSDCDLPSVKRNNTLMPTSWTFYQGWSLHRGSRSYCLSVVPPGPQV